MKIYKNDRIRRFNFWKTDLSKLLTNLQLIVYLSVACTYSAKAENVYRQQASLNIDSQSRTLLKRTAETKPVGRTVRATVTDSDGAPVSGLSVEVKASPQVGTTADESGNYILTLDRNAILVFRYVGKLSQESN